MARIRLGQETVIIQETIRYRRQVRGLTQMGWLWGRSG